MHIHSQDPYAVPYSRSGQQEPEVDFPLEQSSGEREDRGQSSTATSFCCRCVKLSETRCGKLLLGAGLIAAVGSGNSAFNSFDCQKYLCASRNNYKKH